MISSTDTNLTQKCLDMALMKTNIKTWLQQHPSELGVLTRPLKSPASAKKKSLGLFWAVLKNKTRSLTTYFQPNFARQES